jgi:hypothetical protein
MTNPQTIGDQAIRWNLLLWPMALVFTLATSLPLIDAITRVIHPAAKAGATISDYLFLTVLVLTNAGFLSAAIYVTVRSRKFGRSRLELSTTPIATGGDLVGVIITGKPVAFASSVRVTLLCEERRITGNRAGNCSTLWASEQVIDLPPFSISAIDTRIPVHFTIPADCSPTTRKSPYITWRLAAHALVDGVDYYATFRVPIVKSAGRLPTF